MSEPTPDATAPAAPVDSVPVPVPTPAPAPVAFVPVPKKRHRGRTVAIVLVALALVVGGVVTILTLQSNANAQQRPQSMTRIVTAQKGTQTTQVSLTGTLAPRTQSDLSFAVSGTVTKVYIKVGDQVKKGQKLAAIDNSSLKDAVNLAQANLTSANASYTEAVDNSASSASIKAAKARVDSAKAALDSAKKDLANAVLTSSINGTVAVLNLTVGDTVGSSGGGGGAGGNSSTASSTAAQVSVISTATWKVNATVGSADLGSLKAGQKASIQADGAAQPLEGTVASVGIVASSTSNNGSATFPVVVNIAGKQTGLYSGTTATVVVTTATAENVLTVPTMAISTVNGKTQVNRLTTPVPEADLQGQGRVAADVQVETTPVEVTVGRVFGPNTEITAGLSEGDQLAITIVMRQPSGNATTGTRQGGGGNPFGGMGGLGGGQVRQIDPGGGGGGQQRQPGQNNGQISGQATGQNQRNG